MAIELEQALRHIEPIIENPHGATIEVIAWPIEGPSGKKKELVGYEVTGRTPGILVVCVGGIHGNEDTGKEAVRAIGDTAIWQLIKGRFLGIPEANPGATERGMPDLNRSFEFPGNAPATDIHENARVIIEVTTGAHAANKRCLIVDFHAENGTMIPYIRLDPTEDDDVLGFMMYCAEMLGIPWVMEKEGDELDASLSTYLVKKCNIPALTVECGPEGVANEEYVNAMRAIMRHLMWHLGMVTEKGIPKEQWFSDPSMLPAIERIKAEGPLQLVDGSYCDKNGKLLEVEGRLEFDIKPGQVLELGDRIGYIVDQDEQQIPMYAKEHCIVLSVSDSNSTYTTRGEMFQVAVEVTDERICSLARGAKKKTDYDKGLKESAHRV
jgi:predicted deacylase